MADTEKLQKILADSGLGSRREMEKWIAAGRVTVNGKVATLGDRALRSDNITVDDKRLKQRHDENRLIMLNKPEGTICSRGDERANVFDLLPKLSQGRWISVGRLDINTSGLLLFTNNGDVANKLMHPSSNLEREYLVRVLGEVSDKQLSQLLKGVMLDDGMAKFTDIVGPRGKGKNQWYNVIIKEGRKREVRRLWESQGCTVSRLKRIRFGDYRLPRNLPIGQTMVVKIR